jgi:hypothetical protein
MVLFLPSGYLESIVAISCVAVNELADSSGSVPPEVTVAVGLREVDFNLAVQGASTCQSFPHMEACQR